MDDLLRTLEEAIIKNYKRQIGLHLLYKASSDGYSVETFHTLCDNKGPTITVLHGVRNTWYGGYTSQSWTSEVNKYVPDTSAFLFWKQQTQGSALHTMPIKSNKISSAIKCDRNQGPTFGWTVNPAKKHDLQTFSKKVKNADESVNEMFKLDGHLNIGGAYDLGQFTNAQINGGMMEVHDLEVYQVYDDEIDSKIYFQQIPDGQVHETKKELMEMKPLDGLGITCYNVLLLGVIGSGKSSLCNTVRSTFLGDITKAASVGNQPHSITSEFPERATQVEKSKTKPYEGLKNEIHLVCFVADATKLQVIDEESRNSLLKSQQIIQRKGIPRVCVLTKIDELCPNVAREIKHVYKSKRVHDAIRVAAVHFGMEEHEVFPVCNYINEKVTDTARDSLVIQAVQGMFKLITGSLSRNLGAASTEVDHWARRGVEIMKKLGSMKKRIADELDEMNVDHNIRLLLLGNINSGKSSFVNTVLSAFKGKVRKFAPVGTAEDGTTSKFREYKQKLNDGGRDRNVPITICDIPGFGRRMGPSNADVECVVLGHVPNNTEMTSSVTPDIPRYRQQPKIAHKIHCVCFVCDISQMENLKVMKEDMKAIAKMLKRNDVPSIAILTKCDILWPGITSHLQEIFGRREIEECAKVIADLLEIAKREIYPIVNYVDQAGTEELMDAFALDALSGVIDASSAFLEACGSDEED